MASQHNYEPLSKTTQESTVNNCQESHHREFNQSASPMDSKISSDQSTGLINGKNSSDHAVFKISPVQSACLVDGKGSSGQSASPIDGKWAVVVVIAAFFSQVVLAIMTYSLPIFTLEWEKTLYFTPSQVSWAITLIDAVRYLTAPVIGALINRFGCRPVAMLGGLFAMVATIFLSQTTALWEINLCCAVIGMSIGLARQATVISINVYFDKWLGRASGFAQGGIGIGIMIGSPLMALLIEFYTWRGAALILAGIAAHCSVLAAVYRPLSWWSSQNRLFKEKTVADEPMKPDNEEVNDIPNSFGETTTEDHRGNGEIKQSLEPHCLEEVVALTSGTEQNSDARKQQESCTTKMDSVSIAGVVTKPGLLERLKIRICNTNLLELSGFSLMLSDRTVMMICLTSVTQGSGYFSIFLYLSSFIASSGETELRTSLIFTIIGICSLCGRLVIGFIIDSNVTTTARLLALSAVTAGCSVFMIFFGSYTGFATFAVLFGLSSGAVSALSAILVKKYTAPSQLVHAFALQSFFYGGSQLVGTYFLSLLYDWTNMYIPCFSVSGVLLIVSGFISVLIDPVSRRMHRKEESGFKIVSDECIEKQG